MYIPKINSWDDLPEILRFIDRFSFGILISTTKARIVGTHIPFLYNNQSDNLKLEAHLAFANPQWKDIEGQEVLVIFSEPHGYISTRNYQKEETVPTWNYLAVHLYGKVNILHGEEQISGLMERAMIKYEPAYYEKWKTLSEAFKKRMLKGIVPFEIEVTEVQAKAKLSQNKTVEEMDLIIADLKESGIPGEALLAEYMAKVPGTLSTD